VPIAVQVFNPEPRTFITFSVVSKGLLLIAARYHGYYECQAQYGVFQYYA
jgi:hypothetical protein